MRQLILIACVLLAATSIAPAQTDSVKIDTTRAAGADTTYHWIASYDSAMALATAGKKNILASFETEWSRWCIDMRDSVWTDPVWHPLARGLVYLRLDGDKDSVQVNQFRVLRYPTTILITSGGQEIERWIGFHKAHDLVDSVNDALEGTGTLWDLERISQKDKTNAKVLYAMARKYLERGELDHAYEYLSRASTIDQNNAAGVQDDVMFVMAMISRRQQNWFKSIEQLRQLLKKFPQSEWREDAELYIPWLYAQAGDTTEAVKRYTGFLENYKSSSETQWVQRQLSKLEKTPTPTQ